MIEMLIKKSSLRACVNILKKYLQNSYDYLGFLTIRGLKPLIVRKHE
jgi:hypothetical protein